MGRQCTVKFRGEEIDVEVDHDGGYESDTNAHTIEWHFVGLTAEQHDALGITQDEEDAIYLELSQLSDERFDDDVI